MNPGSIFTAKCRYLTLFDLFDRDVITSYKVTGQSQAQAPVFIPRAQPPVKRERKGIQIIDPNTNLPIDITGDSTPTASVSVSRSSPASVVPNVDVSETRPNIDNEDVSEVFINY